MSTLTLDNLPVIDDAWATLRQSGRESFAAQGLPGMKTEAWKYTNLSALANEVFAPAPVMDRDFPSSAFAAVSDTVVAFNNGRAQLPSNLPKGLTICGMAEAPADLAAKMGSIAQTSEKPLAALNLAAFEEALFIHVARGVMVEDPLLLDFRSFNDSETAILHHPRVLLVLEDGAALTVIEHHHGEGLYFCNPVAEIALGRDSNLRHYKIQDEAEEARHTAVIALTSAENANVESFVLHNGAKLARHEWHHLANGEHLNVRVNGACLGTGTQHHDLVTLIDLAAANCNCNELYKVVLDDKARSAFHGKFLVRQDSQKVDARMLCNNLILSQGAEADAKPELEIYADDVQCAHGATTGQMNQNALFFLRQRGMSEEDARAMLTRGFVMEAVETISHEGVRDLIDGMILGGPQ